MGDALWNDIKNIVNGLDEYYLKYGDENDAHWLIQSWFERWIVLNDRLNATHSPNNFMNHYIVSVLMKNKLETRMDITSNIGRCYLVEAMLDVMYATKYSIDHSQYKYDENDPFYLFNQTLSNVVQKRYNILSQNQLFKDKVDFYFESRFDGAFVGDGDNKRIRIDDTQHCLCALMKIHTFYYQQNEYVGPIDDDDKTVNNGFLSATNYDIMISAICLVVVIILVNIIFFYWCHYYPKEQKQRNDLFWLGQLTGQTMESATSDNNQYDSEYAKP